MAEEKEALSEPTPAKPPQEAPPAYDSLNSSYLKNTTPDTWRRAGALSQQPISLSNTPTTTTPNAFGNLAAPPAHPFPPPKAKGHVRSLSSSSTMSLKSKKSWFNFTSSSSSSSATSTPSVPPPSTSSRTANEVRTTVCGLVRNLVVGPEGSSVSASSFSPATQGILQSCSEACATHRMSFSAILQDKFVESHSPLYWAIVKRPVQVQPTTAGDHSTTTTSGHLLDREDIVDEPESTETGEEEDEADLLGALLSHCSNASSTSLLPETIVELRQACLATSDQATFRRLCLSIPQFSQTSAGGADRVLLSSLEGGGGAGRGRARGDADEVTVNIYVGEGSGAHEGAFSVFMGVPQFHRRMMVSREVGLEFVARNRIWRLSFYITPDDAPSWSGPPPGSWCISLSLQEPSPPTWFDGRLILVSPGSPTADADKPNLRFKAKQMLEAPKAPKPNPAGPFGAVAGVGAGAASTGTKVLVQMDENPAFSGLQYSGSPHIHPVSEKLTLRLEARLRKPALGDLDDGVW